MVDKPYQDTPINNNTFIREFNESVDSEEMVWHRDHKNRTVKIIEGEGWQFQNDNRLPFSIRKNDNILIRAGKYHRLIKGTSKLVVEITES